MSNTPKDSAGTDKSPRPMGKTEALLDYKAYLRLWVHRTALERSQVVPAIILEGLCPHHGSKMKAALLMDPMMWTRDKQADFVSESADLQKQVRTMDQSQRLFAYLEKKFTHETKPQAKSSRYNETMRFERKTGESISKALLRFEGLKDGLDADGVKISDRELIGALNYGMAFDSVAALAVAQSFDLDKAGADAEHTFQTFAEVLELLFGNVRPKRKGNQPQLDADGDVIMEANYASGGKGKGKKGKGKNKGKGKGKKGPKDPPHHYENFYQNSKNNYNSFGNSKNNYDNSKNNYKGNGKGHNKNGSGDKIYQKRFNKYGKAYYVEFEPRPDVGPGGSSSSSSPPAWMEK